MSAALRMALRAMLADLLYPTALKAQPLVDARLSQGKPWSDEVTQQMTALALRWANAQSKEVETQLRQTIGETVSEDDPAMLPQQARRESIRNSYLMSHSTGDTMATLPALEYEVTQGRSAPREGPMSELYGQSELEELARQAEYMNVPPFNTPPRKHENALQAVRRGRVSAHPQQEGVWLVQGSQGSPYQVGPDGCTCPQGRHGTRTKYQCYHAVAAELYQRWQRALQPWLMTPPPTPDERLAQRPQEGPQQPAQDEIDFGDEMQQTLEESETVIDDMPSIEEPVMPTVTEHEPVSNGVHIHEASVEAAPLPPSMPQPVDAPVPCYLAQDKIERSTHIEHLVIALSKAQQKLKNPPADTKNPHFRSQYASLADVRDTITPVLAEQGLAVTQLITTEPDAVLCTSILWHTSGQYLSSTLRLPVPKPDAQSFGSTITYARRYSLMGLCNVAGEVDDDAETVRPKGRTDAEWAELGRSISRLLREQGFTGQGEEAMRAEVKRRTNLEMARANYEAILTALKTSQSGEAA